MPQPVNQNGPQNDRFRETVCVHTDKIFDACKNRDCYEDLRVWLTLGSQIALNAALSAKVRTAELLYVDADVEPVQFNRGYYTVDLSWFYRVSGETALGLPLRGLAIAHKRVLLYGSEGSAHVFKSDRGIVASLLSSNTKPVAIVEALEPIVLDSKVTESDAVPETEAVAVPEELAAQFEEALCFDPSPRQLYVTLGQFSMVRLERDCQLLLPAYDYCVPDKECADAATDDPCSLFSRIDFPVDEFFPPDTMDNMTESYREIMKG